jgi:uncharacterized circularly permuted ATP-grasp superfamily protein/uncharacterized alpha-E superfamily protein
LTKETLTASGFGKYTTLDGYWDEAVLPSGYPRRHYRNLFVEVGRLGPRQLSRRWQRGQQLLQAQGVTYNPGGLREGYEHTWPMDPIPLVIAEGEWASIERAVTQRASLLNAMLADLFGPQQLLHRRHIPSALVFANPHFLRPCVGIVPTGGVHLQTYAADIARSPDGQWWVVADRTQAPSGMGYTLQNRLVSSRTLPGVFDRARVRQLARFFDRKRQALLELAGKQRANPTVVLLTPGPHNETYFEHSFLAGQWGFTLVEGADLMVSERRVYVRTLGGLKPVDLILRRLDDSYADPIELRGDSLLGVPGLVDAARAGSVALDNALGSGLVETAVHMAFLPGLCRHLLGEALAMPSVATWWCGQPGPLSYVKEHLRDLVIKPSFPRYGRRPEFPDKMTGVELEDLKLRIDARPEEFVAQERVALSTVPVRTEAGFAPRHVMLRVYAVWDGSGYTVLPGGLTRVSTEDNSMIVSMQLGAGSKDTWVLGHEEDEAPSRRQLALPIGMQGATRDLPSRVADNLFWMGRYTERVEARVRFVRTLLPALAGEEEYGHAVSLETAVRLLARLEYLPRETSSASLGEQRWQVQRLLTEMVYDASQTSGLRWNLKEMRRTALHLKERLSADTWRVLQQLENQFSDFVPSGPEARIAAGIDLLDSAVVSLSAFSGLLMENTTRGYGWRFLEIGRRLERAAQCAQLIRYAFSAAPRDIEAHLQFLLQAADSSITYRTRFPTLLQPDLVLGLLLTDEANPRAVGFQLATLLHQIDRLEGLQGQDTEGKVRDLAFGALASLRDVKLAEIVARNEEAEFAALEDLVDQLKVTLYELSDALTASYLSPVKTSRLWELW